VAGQLKPGTENGGSTNLSMEPGINGRKYLACHRCNGVALANSEEEEKKKKNGRRCWRQRGTSSRRSRSGELRWQEAMKAADQPADNGQAASV